MFRLYGDLTTLVWGEVSDLVEAEVSDTVADLLGYCSDETVGHFLGHSAGKFASVASVSDNSGSTGEIGDFVIVDHEMETAHDQNLVGKNLFMGSGNCVFFIWNDNIFEGTVDWNLNVDGQIISKPHILTSWGGVLSFPWHAVVHFEDVKIIMYLPGFQFRFSVRDYNSKLNAWNRSFEKTCPRSIRERAQ